MPPRDSDDSSEEVKEVEPLPPHRVRFTDMPWPLVDKAIRRKYHCIKLNLAKSIVFTSVIEKATENAKVDKDLASEIQMKIKADSVLEDETAGWHVICGKSFASAITYQTTWVLFVDLLEGHHKSFLMFKTQ